MEKISKEEKEERREQKKQAAAALKEAKKAQKEKSGELEESDWESRKATRQKNKENAIKAEELAKKQAKQPHVAKPGYLLSCVNINKIYSNRVQALFDFNLDVKPGEFIVLVGPSGCGKSTTLRVVAGLEDATNGELFIDGKYSNKLEPKDRGVAMVFQSYALYPHLSVYENLSFGLYKLPKDEIKRRVDKAAKILQIEEYLDRKPTQLSGGQCQRVALGRAIVRNAKLFLLDEPLSNLDAKLRVQMRSELVALHAQLGNTMLYVTHDQTEAMTMADRIVVMSRGRIQQVGTPLEVYEKPVNVFVATFIGSPTMNIIEANFENGSVVLPHTSFALSKDDLKKYSDFYLRKVTSETDPKKKQEYAEMMKKDKRPLLFGLRPEDIVEGVKAESGLTAPTLFKIDVSELLGAEYFIHFVYGDSKWVAKIPAAKNYQAGEKIPLCFNKKKIHLFDPISKERIL